MVTRRGERKAGLRADGWAIATGPLTVVAPRLIAEPMRAAEYMMQVKGNALSHPSAVKVKLIALQKHSPTIGGDVYAEPASP